MILFDQVGIPKANSVITAATTACRILLRQAQARQCFSRIQYFAFGMTDEFSIFAGKGGGRGKRLQIIQGSSLSG